MTRDEEKQLKKKVRKVMGLKDKDEKGVTIRLAEDYQPDQEHKPPLTARDINTTGYADPFLADQR